MARTTEREGAFGNNGGSGREMTECWLEVTEWEGWEG